MSAKSMEKISILGLSLVLTTGFSISSTIPYMSAYFRHLPPSQIETLVSLPSAGIICSLLLNNLFEKIFAERQRIITGLLIFSLCGIAPFFVQDYLFIFSTRLICGIGIGLINTKAISIISERYDTKEKIKLLGYRGAAEIVGAALLTFFAGQLMAVKWTYAFLVYGAGFIVLLFFILFVPYEKTGSRQAQNKVFKMTVSDWELPVYLSLLAGIFVCSNVALLLQTPNILVVEIKETASTASLVLSLIQLVGILSGLSFPFFLSFFKVKLLPLVGTVFGISLFILSFSDNLLTFSLAAIFSGFVYGICPTMIFHLLSEKVPRQILSQATSIIVLGCCLGAVLAPIAANLLIGIFQSSTRLFLGLSPLVITVSLTSPVLLKKI